MCFCDWLFSLSTVSSKFFISQDVSDWARAVLCVPDLCYILCIHSTVSPFFLVPTLWLQNVLRVGYTDTHESLFQVLGRTAHILFPVTVWFRPSNTCTKGSKSRALVVQAGLELFTFLFQPFQVLGATRVVTHTCKSSPGEVEPGELLQVWGQHRLHEWISSKWMRNDMEWKQSLIL